MRIRSCSTAIPVPGTVPDFVPSFHVHQDQVAWTAFDFGPDGEALSRLLYARAPDWTPVVVAERDARLAELWFPSLRDTQLVYCEVIYSADRTTDERHVYLVDAAHLDIAPRRLDTSGRATMPILLVNGGVVWKEADPGFSMFNWGTMYHYDEATGEVTRLPMRPQEYVNYPSAGARFIAAWGADTHSVRRLRPGPGRRPAHRSLARRRRTSASFGRTTAGSCSSGWRRRSPATTSEQVRFAFLPSAGTDRDRDRAPDQGRVMRMTSSASSSCASVRRPSSTCPRSTTTWRIVLRSASACLAMLAASS